MDSMKPALEALDAIIADVEKALALEKPNPASKQSLAANGIAESARGDTSGQKKADKKKKKKEKKEKQPSAPATPPEVSQFLQCDLRVGKIIEVGYHPEADGLYMLKVSYGEGDENTRTVCAGMRNFIPESEMRDRMVVSIINLKPRKLRGITSEAMILAGSLQSGEGGKETVVPLAPPEGAKIGAIVGARGIVAERTVVDGKFVSGKTWDKAAPRLRVESGNACYDGKPLVVGDAVIRCDLPDGAEIH